MFWCQQEFSSYFPLQRMVIFNFLEFLHFIYCNVVLQSWWKFLSSTIMTFSSLTVELRLFCVQYKPWTLIYTHRCLRIQEFYSSVYAYAWKNSSVHQIQNLNIFLLLKFKPVRQISLQSTPKIITFYLRATCHHNHQQ